MIEIDPAVTEVSYEHLGLRPDTRIISYNRDARIVLMEWDNPPVFDVIYGDAFNDLSIPYHLTTVEFHRMLYDHLSDDGVYLANVIDDYESGEMLRAFINTMGEVFPPHLSGALGEVRPWRDRNDRGGGCEATTRPRLS